MGIAHKLVQCPLFKRQNRIKQAKTHLDEWNEVDSKIRPCYDKFNSDK